MRTAVIFLVLLLRPLSLLPSAASAGPLSLFMARSTRSTTARAAVRPHQTHIARLSRAVAGAATAIRKLTGVRDRPICVEGRLSCGRLSFLPALDLAQLQPTSGSFGGV